MAVLAACLCLSLTGCDSVKTFLADVLAGIVNGDNEEGDDDDVILDAWAGLVNNERHEAYADGNSLRYGDHVYTIVREIDPATREFKTATASVTFTNVPSGFTEFQAVYDGLLGKSIAGTAAMIPMAMEIYARNAAEGERCFGLLCNGLATVSEITRELVRKLEPSRFSPENDSYIQRYLPAAVLKGAVPSNAYAPEKPYTVEMTMSPNGVKAAPLTGGEVTYIYILAGGWDTYQRGVDIFQADGSDHYKVFNCPSCYTQCKQIRGTWAGLE